MPARAAAGGLDRTLRASSACAEFLLAALAVLVVAEVVWRAVAGRSFEGTEELAGYLLVAIVFLGLAGTVRDGPLLRIDSLSARLGPRGRAALDVACTALALVVTLVLTVLWTLLVVSSYARAVTAPTVLGTPLWLPQLVMPAGGVLLALALCARLADSVAALRRPPEVAEAADDA